MASKANNIMELKPTMTKAKALKLVLDYVKEHGYPVIDVILDGGIDADSSNIETYEIYTFNQLCKLLTD